MQIHPTVLFICGLNMVLKAIAALTQQLKTLFAMRDSLETVLTLYLMLHFEIWEYREHGSCWCLVALTSQKRTTIKVFHKYRLQTEWEWATPARCRPPHCCWLLCSGLLGRPCLAKVECIFIQFPEMGCSVYSRQSSRLAAGMKTTIPSDPPQKSNLWSPKWSL